MILLCTVFHHKYLRVYISTKNGSVFKKIPEIDRKKSTKMELLNFMFSLRYKSKPKRNFFLGHPVYQQSDIKYQILCICYKVSDLKYQMSSFRYQISDINYKISSIRCQVSDIKYHLSNIRYQESDKNIRYQVSYINL